MLDLYSKVPTASGYLCPRLARAARAVRKGRVAGLSVSYTHTGEYYGCKPPSDAVAGRASHGVYTASTCTPGTRQVATV